MPYVPYTNNARTIATALHHQALKRYKNPKAIPSFLLADSWNNHFECVRVPRNIALFGILQVIASRVVCGDPFNAALYHGEGVMRDIRSPKEVMAGVVDTDGDRVLHYTFTILDFMGTSDPKSKYLSYEPIRLGPLFTTENIMKLAHAVHYGCSVREQHDGYFDIHHSNYTKMRNDLYHPEYEQHYSSIYGDDYYRPFQLNQVHLIHKMAKVEEKMFQDNGDREGMELVFFKMLLMALGKKVVMESLKWMYETFGYQMGPRQMNRLKDVWKCWAEDEEKAKAGRGGRGGK